MFRQAGVLRAGQGLGTWGVIGLGVSVAGEVIERCENESPASEIAKQRKGYDENGNLHG